MVKFNFFYLIVLRQSHFKGTCLWQSLYGINVSVLSAYDLGIAVNKKLNSITVLRDRIEGLREVPKVALFTMNSQQYIHFLLLKWKSILTYTQTDCLVFGIIIVSMVKTIDRRKSTNSLPPRVCCL